MKLRNKLSAITAAAMLAFTGVGFAAWTFNNTVTQRQDAGTYVTSALKAENVTLSGDTTVYLVLDQEKPYWSTTVKTGSKPIELTNGKITVTPNFTIRNNNDGSSWDYTITSSIDVNASIAHYVNVTGFDTTNKTGTVSATGVANPVSVDYALPSLSYVTSNVPTTLEEYDEMVTALNGKVISFSFNCTFAEQAA